MDHHRIIALIALFYAAVAAVNKFAGTSVSATGIICGVFMAALAFIGNIFIALWNVAAEVFVLIYNLVATVANFIGTVFNDPVAAVVHLFFDLADTVLGCFKRLLLPLTLSLVPTFPGRFRDGVIPLAVGLMKPLARVKK